MNIVMYTHELKLENQKDLTCLYKERNNNGFVCSECSPIFIEFIQ